MAVPGFRKSFMGYNRDDVNEFIEALIKKYKTNENDLTAKIETLNIDLRRSAETVEELKATVAEYEKKRAEIEQMSRNIGKLYLVSQSNAEAIIENARQSRESAAGEVRRNIDGISSAHESLDGLCAEVNETAKRFNDEIARLTASLDETVSALKALDVSYDANSDTLDKLMYEFAG